jgi:hypothetical protein
MKHKKQITVPKAVKATIALSKWSKTAKTEYLEMMIDALESEHQFRNRRAKQGEKDE